MEMDFSYWLNTLSFSSLHLDVLYKVLAFSDISITLSFVFLKEKNLLPDFYRTQTILQQRWDIALYFAGKHAQLVLFLPFYLVFVGT